MISPDPRVPDADRRLEHLESLDPDGVMRVETSFVPDDPLSMIENLYARELLSLARVGLPCAPMKFPDAEAWALIHPPTGPAPGAPFLLITDEDGTLALDRADAEIEAWLVGYYGSPEDQIGATKEIPNDGPGALADSAREAWESGTAGRAV